MIILLFLDTEGVASMLVVTSPRDREKYGQARHRHGQLMRYPAGVNKSQYSNHKYSEL